MKGLCSLDSQFCITAHSAAWLQRWSFQGLPLASLAFSAAKVSLNPVDTCGAAFKGYEHSGDYKAIV